MTLRWRLQKAGGGYLTVNATNGRLEEINFVVLIKGSKLDIDVGFFFNRVPELEKVNGKIVKGWDYDLVLSN